MIPWDVLQARNFRKDDLERFDKYQAEALVHNHVPLSALYGAVCYNYSARTEMQAAADKQGSFEDNRPTELVPLMITFTEGKLESEAEALVNTVNTVGVMGKGVGLMFKERFPDNFKAYERACKNKQVRLGEVFATERRELIGPKWIINFPQHKIDRDPAAWQR